MRRGLGKEPLGAGQRSQAAAAALLWTEGDGQHGGQTSL